MTRVQMEDLALVRVEVDETDTAQPIAWASFRHVDDHAADFLTLTWTDEKELARIASRLATLARELGMAKHGLGAEDVA